MLTLLRRLRKQTAFKNRLGEQETTSSRIIVRKGTAVPVVEHKTRIQVTKEIETVFLKAVAAGLQRKPIEDPGLSPEKWQMLLKFSVDQALLPVVFEAVYPLLPGELEREYRNVSVKWIANQVRATDSFLRLYRNLQKTGMEPLVIKGIVCRDTYMLSDWRVSSDEDIYIPIADYPRFHEAMGCLGFQSASPNYRSEHELVYRNRELIVEGHWNLFPQETHQWNQMNELAETILQRAHYVNIEGIEILTPEPTDHMIYLLLHAMKHFSLAGVGIRQICDIAMWDEQYAVDWLHVKRVMDAFGGTTFASAVLDAANRYFEMSFPEGWTRVDSTDLVQDALRGGTFGHSSEDRLHSASITAASGGKGAGITAIISSLFPGRKVMEINYPWVSNSPLLLPLGWIVRLILYIGNIKRGASPVHSIKIGKRRARLLQEYEIFRRQENKQNKRRGAC